METSKFRPLKSVYIKELGWNTVGQAQIIEIGEHENNSWVKLVYKEGQDTVYVNPYWIIAKIRG